MELMKKENIWVLRTMQYIFLTIFLAELIINIMRVVAGSKFSYGLAISTVIFFISYITARNCAEILVKRKRRNEKIKVTSDI